MPNLSLRTSHLRTQLRNFERRNDLSNLDPISYINVDPPNVAGDLGVQLYFLIRLEFAGDSQGAR
jgi:hypothetical protein